jgi:hypothetical protein
MTPVIDIGAARTRLSGPPSDPLIQRFLGRFVKGSPRSFWCGFVLGFFSGVLWGMVGLVLWDIYHQ